MIDFSSWPNACIHSYEYYSHISILYKLHSRTWIVVSLKPFTHSSRHFIFDWPCPIAKSLQLKMQFPCLSVNAVQSTDAVPHLVKLCIHASFFFYHLSSLVEVIVFYRRNSPFIQLMYEWMLEKSDSMYDGTSGCHGTVRYVG